MSEKISKGLVIEHICGWPISELIRHLTDKLMD